MKKRILNYLTIIIMAIITAAVLIMWLCGIVDINKVIDFIDDNHIVAALGIFLLFLIKGVCPVIPYAAIVVASSAIFGFPLSFALSFVGTIACISISYFMGYCTKSMSLEAYLERKPKLKKYFDRSNNIGFLFCFITHAVGLSLEAQGIVYGLLKVPYIKYIFSTMLAIFPSMLAYLVLGTAELGLSSPWFYALVLYDMIVIVICSVYLKKNITNSSANECNSKDH